MEVSQETDEETLKEHFGKYREVRESKALTDKVTDYRRRFGFVTFADPSVAGRVLQDEHIILGRTVIQGYSLL
ncbi:unnamed protein product [Ilex paraguariensis]|uniref:RRM domain-containing protein n=1 Tax=Ilex paraguariensis TaxID=185542 RepID=A0ABC8RNC6_9AQUA